MEAGMRIGIILAVVITLVVTGMWYAHDQDAPAREAYASLAQCLDDSGAAFYGAYWCPACSQQKIMFGGAVKKLPYVECSESDRTKQTPACEEAGVTNYPTWVFSDGTRCTGVLDARMLAHLSQCAPPNTDDADQTPQTIYEELAVAPLRDRMERRQVEESQVAELLEVLKSQTDDLLTERYGTTVETEESVANMLDVLATLAYRCEREESTAPAEA